MTTASGGGNGQAPTQTAAPGSGNGQAPTTPPANNGGSPSTAPTGQAPTATQTQQQQQQTEPQSGANASADDLKRIRQELDEARREAANYRTELKKRDDATLTAEQKRERDFADIQAKNLEYEIRLQQQSLQIAGYRLGTALGIGDVGAALALVQAEHAHEIKFSADGTPENISDLLKAVLKDHPVLAGNTGGQQPGSQRPGASSGTAANPGVSARTGTFTPEQVRQMSPEEYAANRATIFEQMKRQQGR